MKTETTYLKHYLPASLMPPLAPRDRRALTRCRTQVVQARTRASNRGQGGLERAHSTLASVATDIMGGSGRAIVAAWIEGRAAPATRAALAKGRWRRPMPVLE